MSKRTLVAWGYIVVALATLLVYILLYLLLGFYELSSFMGNSTNYLIAFIMASFGACVTFYNSYRQQQTTEFGRFLYLKGASEIYAVAIIYPMYIAIGSFLLLLIAMYSKDPLIYNILCVALIYLIINLIALLQNQRELMKLHNGFEAELRKARNGDTKE